MIEFNFRDHTGESRLDDKPIKVMETNRVFSARIRHEAGEHQYTLQSELYPF